MDDFDMDLIPSSSADGHYQPYAEEIDHHRGLAEAITDSIQLHELRTMAAPTEVHNEPSQQLQEYAEVDPEPLQQHQEYNEEIEDEEIDDAELTIGDEREDNLQLVLAMNEATAEIVTRLIENVHAALRRNREKQKFLATRRHELRDENSRKKKVPVHMFLPPYFKDSYNMVPPQNEEMKRKQANMVYDPLLREERKWKKEELTKLHKAVRKSMIDQKLTSLYAQRELLTDKWRAAGASTTTEERQEWREKLANLDRKIRYEMNLPDKDVLVGDYSGVDWATIANKHFKGSRSPALLRLKWINEQCPQVNKSAWTAQELRSLTTLATDNFVSWSVVAERLGTRRTAWQCFEKYKSDLSNDVIRREWTVEEDERLLKLVETLQLNGTIQWDKVTYHMAGRTRQQCRTRYNRTLDKSVRHGRWTDEEDLLLMCAIGRYGAKDWFKVAKGVPGRSDGQCRERWVNVLDRANRTQEWTLEEDEKLLFGLNIFGRGEWAKVASLLKYRNPNQCKCRFRSLLTTKMRLCSAQLAKIRTGKAHGQNWLNAVKRRDRVFTAYNKLMRTKDSTGILFCDEAKERAGTSDMDAKRKARIPADQLQIAERGIAAIERKYRNVNPTVPHAERVAFDERSAKSCDRNRRRLEDAPPTDAESQLSTYETMLRLWTGEGGARKTRTFRDVEEEDEAEATEAPTVEGEEGVSKQRRRFLLTDSQWMNIDFEPEVEEEERRRRMTEALCQLVRKQDQVLAVREIQIRSCDKARKLVEEKIKKKLSTGLERSVAKAMEDVRRGKPGPIDIAPAPEGGEEEEGEEGRGGEERAVEGKEHQLGADAEREQPLIECVGNPPMPRPSADAIQLPDGDGDGDDDEEMEELRPNYSTVRVLEVLQANRALLTSRAASLTTVDQRMRLGMTGAMHEAQSQFLPQLLTDERYIRFKELFRLLFSRPTDLQLALETTDKQTERLEAEMNEAETELQRNRSPVPDKRAERIERPKKPIVRKNGDTPRVEPARPARLRRHAVADAEPSGEMSVKEFLKQNSRAARMKPQAAKSTVAARASTPRPSSRQAKMAAEERMTRKSEERSRVTRKKKAAPVEEEEEDGDDDGAPLQPPRPKRACVAKNKKSMVESSEDHMETTEGDEEE